MNESGEQLQAGPPAPPPWFHATETAATATEISEFAGVPEEIADFVADEWGGHIPPCPHLFWHPLRGFAWLFRTAFGIVTLIFLLAIIAAIPVVNFLALGYLLEVEGRVARSGRLRDAFPLLNIAPRIGTIVIGVWVWIFPLCLLADYASDARLIDPGSPLTLTLRWLTLVLPVLIAAHISLAIARGGGFWCFFRPIKNVRDFIARMRAGTFWRDANARVASFVSRMRPGYLFSLGLRGFTAVAVWLMLPTLLFAAANKTEGGPILVTVFGGLCLTVIFGWIPFLQAHFAAENRFRAIFELGRVRELFRRAPFSWLADVIVVFVFALPLFLLKVRLLPQDAMWFLTLVFIVTIYPAKVVTGWAYHRALTKQKRAWFVWRLLCRILIFLLLAFYTFILFFTQFIDHLGKLALFEHHAFQLPGPFTFLL